LTYEDVNLMFLDEPTNHLDIGAREVLEELLLAYKGTVLFVSHDRYFIKKIASRIAEIRNHKLNYYEGDYEYYRIIKKRELKHQEEKVKQVFKKIAKQKTNEQEPTIEALQNALAKIEQQLMTLEKQMREAGNDFEVLQKLYEEKTLIEEEYEEIFGKIIELE